MGRESSLQLVCSVRALRDQALAEKFDRLHGAKDTELCGAVLWRKEMP